MAQWGNTDDAANSVSWAVSQLNKTANTGNKTALYGNTTQGAFVANTVYGQEGIDTTEIANGSIDADKATHAGWNLKKTGTGPLDSITISAGGTGYSNTDTITVAATGTGSVNAAATIGTDGSGVITSVTITETGAGFATATPTVAIANSTGGASAGSGATLVATAGGRAGRVSYETLVAMGSLS